MENIKKPAPHKYLAPGLPPISSNKSRRVEIDVRFEGKMSAEEKIMAINFTCKKFIQNLRRTGTLGFSILKKRHVAEF